jgi:hypothetical protein
VTILAVSIRVAYDSGGSISIYVVAAALGLALAICNVWVWTKLVEVVTPRLEGTTKARQEWSLGALYACLAVWWIAGAFFAGWCVSTAIGLAHI